MRYMPAKQPPSFPREKRLLEDFGDRLRNARLRRQVSIDTAAARAGISRMTLYRAEKGDSAVSLGTYLRILATLRLESDVDHLAKDDELGRRLQDMALPERRTRRPKAQSSSP
jgi:transcriptional regulator with XRE-family HTH domain